MERMIEVGHLKGSRVGPPCEVLRGRIKRRYVAGELRVFILYEESVLPKEMYGDEI